MTYDVRVVDLRVDIDEKDRDNIVAIQESLRLIQQALDDISSRLEALE